MNSILFALSMCASTPVCQVEYYSFSIGNSYCLEKNEVCCTERECRFTSTLACYPNKIFVGNFESL